MKLSLMMMILVEKDFRCTTVWFGIGRSCISSKLSEQKSRFASGAGEVLRAGARGEERGEPSRVSCARGEGQEKFFRVSGAIPGR